MGNTIYSSTSALANRVIIRTGLVGNRMTFSPIVPPPYGPVITAWAANVVANGGADPSPTTKAALNTFYNGLDSGGLLSKMKSVNCMVPDSLTACLVPLIQPPESASIWTNFGPFVSGDLSVNGLQGDGSTKYLGAGFNASDVWVSNASWGLTLYNTSHSAQQARDWGINNGGAMNIILYTGWDTNDTFAQGNGGAGTDFITYANGGNSTGYWSFNAISNIDKRLFLGRSGTGHNQVSVTNTNGNSYSIIDPAPIKLYKAGLDAGFISNKRFSFAAVHLGLTTAESATLYGLVQAMRTSLGGGYV